MTERELVWAAGLFEGEGTVRINKPTRRNCGTLIVSVVNTDRDVLDFFQARWPGYMKRATGLGPRQRPAWVWVIAARRAAAFLRLIQPFIVRARVLERIDVALQFQDDKVVGRNRPAHYVESQWHSYWWMRELNVRGVDQTCPQAQEWRR